MTSDDDLIALASRIADGSAVDWPQPATDGTHDHIVDDLKVIARLAVLHRTPLDVVSGSDDEAPIGARWGPLTIVRRIGAGRFGQVYCAWDGRLERHVALKLLDIIDAPASAAAATASPTRAIDEARLLARVRHPNVLTVYGAECLEGQTGIWTEYIEGRTLEAVLAAHGPLPPDEVAAIGVDLCRALAAVHDAGLLHRDIKTQNVMRETGGRIILMDFGAGHDLERTPTRAGDLSGTPLYLAPEIFEGAPASQASDLYSVAVVLFRLLTGGHPLPGKTLGEVQRGHRSGRRQTGLAAVPHAPAALIGAIERGLATDPARRFESARAFEAALQTAARAPTHGKDEPARATGTRSVQGGWRLAVAGALIVILVAGVVALLRWRQPSHTTSTLKTPPATPEVHIVRLPVQFAEFLGRPSHDGRSLPYVDTTGNIEVWEVATGKSRRVTDNASADGSITHTLLSPTADRVGYVVAFAGRAFSLHLVNTDGTWPRELVGRETAFEPIPMDWSRDGRLMLCWLRQKDGTSDLVLVPVDGTAQRLLGTIRTPGAPPTASLSPDGRFVAYFSAKADARPPGRSLFVVGADGSAPRAVVDADVHDGAPMWLPNGTGLLFLRDTPGLRESFDAWAVAMTDGVVHGAPRLHASRLGGPYNVALSDDGALYDAEYDKVNELYTAAIDLTGRTPIGPPSRISRTELGNHVSPAYSPDGKSVAYFTTRPSLPGWNPYRTLTIGDVPSGTARKLDLKLGFIDGYRPQWLPNGKSLVMWAADDPSRDRFGYFRIDVETGAATPVLILGHTAAPPYFQCSLDGRALLYADPKRGIVSRDFSTGDETTVIPARKGYGIGPFAIAPTGGAIAFVEYVKNPTRDFTGRVEVRTADGTQRTFGTGPDYLRVAGWTPDGRAILVLKEAGSTGRDELWSLSVSGAEAHDLHFAVLRANGITLSPTGQQIAYGESDGHWELRVREGFLRGLEFAQPAGR